MGLYEFVDKFIYITVLSTLLMSSATVSVRVGGCFSGSFILCKAVSVEWMSC